MRKILIYSAFLVAALLGVSQRLSAQNSLTVDVPAVVAVDDVFQIVFTASGDAKCSNFEAPTFEGFGLLAGPATSTMSSTQIINGKRTVSRSNSYTYTLRAFQEGKFTIGAASVKIGSETYTSKPTVVEVIKPSEKKAADKAAGVTSAGDDLMLSLTLSKSKVVVGEPIIATLKLYVQNSPIGGFEDVKFPTFNGFWSQEIEAPQQIQFVRENLDGEIYNAALLRKYMIIPQQVGNVSIDPAELVCQVQVRNESSGGSRSMFDEFFDSYRTVRKRLYTDEITVKVEALPAGAPASFTGAVGTSFGCTIESMSENVRTHEASSLKIKVFGKGNLGLISAPKVTFPSDFEVYDMKKTEHIITDENGSSGYIIYEYPFIPRAPGDFKMAPVEFSYFDINSRTYKSMSSTPKNIVVAEGEAKDAAVLPGGTSKQSVKSLVEDIRFIATSSSSLKPQDSFLVASPFVYCLLGVIVLGGFLVWIGLRKRIALHQDRARMRNRKAMKVARARLRSAGEYLRQGLYTSFYEELHKALNGYISDKLILPVSELTRDRIAEELAGRGCSQELISELFGVLDACEYARYAPSAGNEAMEHHYQDAMRIISEIES